jgi:hypothetical protein
MGSDAEKLMRLRPVTFRLKSDPTGAVQYGLIAEEVDQVYPELVVRDATGEIQGVRYDELAPMLLNEVQRQERELNTERQEFSEIENLKQQLSDLKRLNESMQTAVAKLSASDGLMAMR